MKLHLYPEGLIVILVALGCILILVEAIFGRREPKYRYEAQEILTENELEFFGRLQRAAPDLYFFPQVAMSALVKPVASDSKTRMAAFRRISQKRVDYAVYTQALQLVCVVELDDKTHDLKKDAIRDEILASAGIETVRWHSKSKPSESEISDQLQRIVVTQI